MLKKLRIRLEPGNPVYLIDYREKRPDLKKSIELVDFEAKNGRIAWTVKCGTGHFISGLVGSEQPIPFLARSWIALYVPVCMHLHPKGFSPDFIICIPGAYGPVFNLKTLR